jgi:L-arabinose transport system ATP-binding protein
MSEAMSAYLQLNGITKSFPGVKALNQVSFSADAGKVHGLIGENGAGKSTLLKILGGEYQPNQGDLFIDGKSRHFANAADAIAAGVAIIHQELQYVPYLSVAENLLLGRLPNRLGFVRSGEAMKFVSGRLRKMGVSLNPTTKLKHLSVAQRQMVEICKALLRDAEIIALDEPTSSLSHRETEILFRLVKDLRAQGKTLIYVSHRLDEIFELCDAATIFRDGRTIVSHQSLVGVTREQLVSEMVGREINDIYDYRARPLGEPRLEVRALEGLKLARPANLLVRRGEILGVFGLVGAGRSELMRLIYGADPKRGGEILLDGVPLPIRRISDAIRHGIVLCPEDRKEEGIIPIRSVSENINISCRRAYIRWGLFVDSRREAKTADIFIKKLRIRTPHRRQLIRFLSGGNQQKTILARWLAESDLKVVILDEPTRGIDVGAKNEIYQIIYQLAERGCAVIVVSSELPEVLGISDRMIVMRGGRISGELAREEANEQKVLGLALPAEEIR